MKAYSLIETVKLKLITNNNENNEMGQNIIIGTENSGELFNLNTAYNIYK